MDDTARRLALLDSFRAAHGGIVLQSPDSDLAEELADLAALPMHRPGWSPFEEAWNSGDPEDVRDELMSHIRFGRERSLQVEWRLPLAVISDDFGGPAGMISLSHDFIHRAGEAVIGTWITGTAQGRGLGTLARRILLGVAFSHLGITKVISVTRADNSASVHINEKLGYRRGPSTIHEYADGQAEKVDFEMTADDWRMSALRLVPETSGVAQLREYLWLS